MLAHFHGRRSSGDVALLLLHWGCGMGWRDFGLVVHLIDLPLHLSTRKFEEVAGTDTQDCVTHKLFEDACMRNKVVAGFN